MSTSKSAFFGLVALAMAVAAALQFFIVFEVDDKCPGSDIHTAPTVAGAALTTSFFANAVWLMARRKNAETTQRAAILVWTLVVVIGIAAAGATLGQIQHYTTLCGGDIKSDTNFNTLQYVSIALLALSVAAPHALKKDKNTLMPTLAADSGGLPLLSGGVTNKSPLVFI
jgi:peptidoglycan biosynthesis protein MviN/MurJ (putative lipid II flippase)